MELYFDRLSIVYFFETIGSPSKYLGFMVSESRLIPPSRCTHVALCETSHSPVFNSIWPVSITPKYRRLKVEAFYGATSIESVSISFIRRA